MIRMIGATIGCVLAMLSACSKTSTYVEYAPAEIQVTVIDAETGNALDGLLLATVYQQTPEVVRPIIAGPPHGHYETVRVELSIVASGWRLRQAELSRREHFKEGKIFTRFQRIEYYVVKPGYQIAALTHELVAGYAKTGRPAVLRLSRVTPGDVHSDVEVISYAEFFAKRIVPSVRKDDALRGRLVEILMSHADAVPSDSGSKEEAEEAVKKLRLVASE